MMNTEKTRSNWSDLQLDLLESILRRLAVVDIARFKVVCSFWNTAARFYTTSPVYRPLVPQTPWLMLPREPKHRDNVVDTHRFFSLTEKKVYTFRNLFQGFGEDEKYLLGSSHGWLLMSDSKTKKSLHLFNPISRVRILLPPLGFMVDRVFLSSDPSCNKTFYVVAAHDVRKRKTKLAFHKHGDDDGNSTTWTDLNSTGHRLDEIIFHNGLLYALSSDSKSISVWDFGGTYPIGSIDFQTLEGKLPFKCHLVESLGELLLVLNLYKYYEVYKVNLTPNKKVEFLKVKCLQERAIVLSEDQPTTMSLSTVDFPELEGNSIYIAQQHGSSRGVLSNVGAYNLESKSCNTYYTSPSAQQDDRHRQLLWIVP